MSATSAAASACDGSWMSVRIGKPSAFTPARMRKPSFKPGTAVRAGAGAIGLVEARLEDELAHRGADAVRHAVDVLFAFDDAGPGDQDQALAEIAELNRHGRTVAPQSRPGAAGDTPTRRR